LREKLVRKGKSVKKVFAVDISPRSLLSLFIFRTKQTELLFSNEG